MTVVVIVLGVVYAYAVFIAGIHVFVDGSRSARGIVWVLLALPFRWLWRGAAVLGAFMAVAFLPPERAPRRSRHELELRIAELERDLELDR